MVAKKNIKKSTNSRRKRTPAGDIISISNIGAGSAVAAGRNSSAKVISDSSSDLLKKWVLEINTKIDKLIGVSQSEKEDIKEQVEKISAEAQKGSRVEKNRLEKLLNTLSIMAPDIFEVIITTLRSPLAGIGIVVKKIGDKVKLEADSK